MEFTSTAVSNIETAVLVNSIFEIAVLVNSFQFQSVNSRHILNVA